MKIMAKETRKGTQCHLVKLGEMESGYGRGWEEGVSAASMDVSGNGIYLWSYWFGEHEDLRPSEEEELVLEEDGEEGGELGNSGIGSAHSTQSNPRTDDTDGTSEGRCWPSPLWNSSSSLRLCIYSPHGTLPSPPWTQEREREGEGMRGKWALFSWYMWGKRSHSRNISYCRGRESERRERIGVLGGFRTRRS